MGVGDLKTLKGIQSFGDALGYVTRGIDAYSGLWLRHGNIWNENKLILEAICSNTGIRMKLICYLIFVFIKCPF